MTQSKFTFGAKTEPQWCSRCHRRKDEAIREQKAKGSTCDDANCTYKQAIQAAIGVATSPPFVSKYCNQCGKLYNNPTSNFCSYCGKKRN